MVDYALMNQHLYEGNAKEVEQMTKDAIAEGRPVQEVMNEGLIAGMSVVGEDFKHNVLYVPEVLIAARAMKAGIPVIELDRQTNGTPGKDYTAFVGGDNYKIAFEAGVYTAKTLLPNGGEVAVLEGLPSSTPAVQRLNGFKDGVKQNSKIKVVAEQAADWLPDKAQTAFSAMLQANPDIKVVSASNDMVAAGSYLAAKGAGKEGQIGIIGTDGLPGPAGGIRAVASGQWAATFTYPTGAAEALDLAKKILIDCAASVPDTVMVPTLAITMDNAAETEVLIVNNRPSRRRCGTRRTRRKANYGAADRPSTRRASRSIANK
jgi:hypothetical protein